MSTKNHNYTGVDMLIAQLCQTLCSLMDCSPPGSSVHGILQARILEWVTISFFRESSQSKDQPEFSALHSDSYHLSHQEILGFPRYC